MEEIFWTPYERKKGLNPEFISNHYVNIVDAFFFVLFI